MSDYTAQIVELEKKLDPAHVKPAPQGKYGDYIEGWHAIAEANRIFGYDGWAYDVQQITLTNEENNGGKHRVGYMAHVKVNALGTVRGDVGHGQGFGKSLGDAHDSAAKEAVTDALKRALRSFGNPFGLALYDKTKANVGVEAGDNEIEAAIEGVNACDSLESLIGYWSNLNKNAKHVAADGRVIQAKDVRKTELEK